MGAAFPTTNNLEQSDTHALVALLQLQAITG